MHRFALLFVALLVAGAPLAVADDLEDAYNYLTEALGKKEVAPIKSTAIQAITVAAAVQAGKPPQEPDQKEIWAKRVKSAQDVQTYAEYALYSMAVQSEPEIAVDLFSALEQHAPKSKYLDQGYANYFDALTKTGAGSKINAVAKKALSSLPNNVDCLMVLMEAAYGAQDLGGALGYAERLVASFNKADAPEGMAAADWSRKKGIGLGRGYWTAGMVYSQRQQHAQADKSLRAALPYIKGIDSMRGPALFFLGVANYNLGRMTMTRARVKEAADFSKQAAAIPGPYADQAWRNVRAMEDEAAKMR